MKEIYGWIPWFSKLGEVIENDGREELARKARLVNWESVDSEFLLLRYGDQNIDPLSFFYSLASRNTSKILPVVCASVSEVFGLPEVAQGGYELWAFKKKFRNLLFHDGGKGKADVLWRLFKSARQGLKHIRSSDFNDALQIKFVAHTKLTEVLFLINPGEFVPINDRIDSLCKLNIRSEPFGFEKYQQILEKISNKFPSCRFHEIEFLLKD